MNNHNPSLPSVQELNVAHRNYSPSSLLHDMLSIAEAASRHKITRQAVYVAIKTGKLRAEKVHSRWVIRESDLEEYRQKRYCRTRSTFQGAPLFDNRQGFYSVNQTAEKLGVAPQKIYYATRAGLLKGSRKGAAWVFHEQDIAAYKADYLDRVPPRFKAV